MDGDIPSRIRPLDIVDLRSRCERVGANASDPNNVARVRRALEDVQVIGGIKQERAENADTRSEHLSSLYLVASEKCMC